MAFFEIASKLLSSYKIVDAIHLDYEADLLMLFMEIIVFFCGCTKDINTLSRQNAETFNV